MVIYVPGTEETDPKKQNMSLQQLGGAAATLQTSVAANTANIATNTTNIASNTASIATNTSDITNLKSPALFRVTLATQQSIAASTFTKIVFDTVAFDNKSWWDATNFAYKPQQAGYYRISWSVFAGASGTLTRTLARARLNVSTDISNGSDAPGAAGVGSSVGSDVIHLNGSSDNVGIYAFITAATPVVGLTGSAFLTTFSGEFIGT